MERLIHAIRSTPLIDSHAHPLLIPSAKARHPLLGITPGEKNSDTLKATSSLAHIRATNQLADILACAPTWNAVLKAIAKENEKPGDVWAKRCIEGIETILFDQGLNADSDAFEYSWHDKFTSSKCKRIVSIERLAAEIVDRNLNVFTISEDIFFISVIEGLQEAINDALSDPEVVGFKSTICYRTGLDILRSCPLDEVKVSLLQCVGKQKAEGHTRFKGLEGQLLNCWAVHMAAGLIQSSSTAHKKAIQFHTGLGNIDPMITRSSSSHLQDFIREYPDVRVVLHAGYPWTKEAGYLATIYSNVYVDIGEVIPFVSQDGQEALIRDLLECCPTEKVVWSTGGHWFPETYLLAKLQIRQAFEKVLTEYVDRKALTIDQAVEFVEDVFFNTSNEIYDLGLDLVPYRTPFIERSINGVGRSDGSDGVSTDLINDNNCIDGINGIDGTSKINETNISGAEITNHSSDLKNFESFMAKHPEIKFLRVQYVDYCSMIRLRILPIKRVQHILYDKKVDVDIGITNLTFNLTPDDHFISSVPLGGLYRKLHAVLSSMRPGPCKYYASAQAEIRNSDNSALDSCPRTNLRSILNKAKNHGLEFLVGFEIEVIFMKGILNEDDNTYSFTSLPGTDSHCWGSSITLSRDIIDAMGEIVDALSYAGIDIEQWHPESATNQFEFVLPAYAPLEAADILLQAREIIFTVARNHGWSATFHPKPLSEKPGTGAHVHLSISSPKGENEETYTSFYAGILKHLRSITAFTYSKPASYDRMSAAGCWSGSTWVAWGTENRDAPLRKIEGSHWEFRSLDGLANIYLSLAALIGAGVEGVIAKEKLTWLDCDLNPAQLSQAERDEYNIEEMLPCTLDEALAALLSDQDMNKILGKAAVLTYVAMKRAELELLNPMTDEQKRNWLIERY